jgi:hypothetical protein
MGTYISYRLTILNNKLQPFLKEEDKPIIATLREENEDAECYLDESGDSTGDGCWQNADADLCEFSKKYPDLIFQLFSNDNGTAELESGCFTYFKNGLYQECFEESTYPEYDENLLHEPGTEQLEKENEEKEFPNGFTSWQETHFEIVAYITNNREGEVGEIYQNVSDYGTGGLYELAEKWTDEFEKLNEGRAWDGEFFDEIEQFCNKKNK